MRHRILIVDDYAPVRGLLREWLESMFPGTDVVEGASGEEAVAGVLASAPDVVLMDIGLPGMSGMEAARRISALAPGVRIVMLSALDGKLLRDKALAEGASAYISKSRMHNDLIPVLTRLLPSGTSAAPGA